MAANLWVWHEGDTGPAFTYQVVDQNNNPVNLTTATSVLLRVADAVSECQVLSAAATVVNASAGLISYTFATPLPVGNYSAVVTVVNGGITTSYPYDGELTFQVMRI